MKGPILLDTGPLVAALDRNDRYHPWAAAQWVRVDPPLLTCEPVLTEACFLLRRAPPGPSAVIELVKRGIIELAFRLEEHVEPVSHLFAKYANVPISLADACLIRMAEVYPESTVLTLDRDFRLYRKHGRQVVPVVIPDD